MSLPSSQDEHKESSPSDGLPEEGGPSSSSSPDDSQIDAIRRNFYQKLMVCEAQGHTDMEDSHEDVQVLEEVTVDGVIKYMLSDQCTNIITLAGAGISTAAGIPDFRSPGSGLYHNLQKYNLPEPQAIFDIGYFSHNPEPFFTLAKELLPGKFKPTISHYFVRLLKEKGMLLRHYTQNIDTLERVAGLPESHLIEAHGSFHTSHCIHCRKEYSIDWNKHFAECTPATMVPKCEDCDGIVKPDIVFFGEKLPDRFHDCMLEDFDKCDLLIIMGSSLEVQPFASLTDRVPPSCPRLLINRERTGVRSGGMELRARVLLESLMESHTQPSEALLAGLHSLLAPGGLMLGQEENHRDVEWLGDCDSVCQMLADKLGWGDDLRALVKSEQERLQIDNPSTSAPVSPHHPASL